MVTSCCLDFALFSDRKIALTNSFTMRMADEKTAFLDDYFAVVIRGVLRLLVCKKSSGLTEVVTEKLSFVLCGRRASIKFSFILSCPTDDGAIGEQFAALALKL